MIQIEVQRESLLKAFAVATLTVGKGTDLSAHYLFRTTSPSTAEIIAYDVVSFSGSPLECVRIEGSGAFTIEAWRIEKILSATTDGVLVIRFDDGAKDVSIKTPSKAKVFKYQTLDASRFPYWDNLYNAAKAVGTISPDALSQGLNFAAKVAGEDDTNRPELCQVEIVDGAFRATDRTALALVRTASPFPGLSLRIPAKEVPKLLSFLNHKNTAGGPVEILVADRPATEGGGGSAFFRRSDGAYLGVARPHAAFPDLRIDPSAPDEADFTVPLASFDSALAHLGSSADKDHGSVTFRYTGGNNVSAFMPAVAGGESEYPLEVSGIRNGELFAGGFTVDFKYLTRIARVFNLDSITFGVTPRGKKGYVSIRHADAPEKGGNTYYSVVVWRG